MSTADEALEIIVAEDGASALTGRWRRFGDLLERTGEWLNPLLVKECRQALKSRQFAITFLLVLVLCWLWSLFGIAQMGPMAGYRFNGPGMFFWYYVILAAALLLIVPYSAYRSLIAEREDNTFELVAITNLRPRQIIGGKLGSAIVQNIVYLSAVAPCLTFTYLLRGIDMPTILTIVFYTFLGSIGLSLFALLVATISKEKHWQIVISVVVIIGLLFVLFFTCMWIFQLLSYDPFEFQSTEFWIGNLAFLTFYFSTFALLYLAAGAQLTFTAENRSTSLRVAMLVQQVLLAAWVGFFAISDMVDRDRRLDDDALQAYIATSVLYWAFMGVLMSGESPDLSARVRRGLPSSFLGRMFLTWFAPGPGTGFMFALGNVLGAGLLAVVAGIVSESTSSGGIRGQSLSEIVVFFIIATSYLMIYLGLGNLILRLLRPVIAVTLAGAVLLQIILLTAGIGGPWLLLYWGGSYSEQYSLIHLTNPFWSSSIATSSGAASANAGSVMVVVVPLAIVFTLLNLWYIVPAVQAIRIPKPKRVAEEDEAQAAAQKPAISQPSSPWDE